MDLGISPEELRELVVKRAADLLLAELDDRNELLDVNGILRAAVEERVGPITEQIGKDVIEPRVQALIEGITFQKTSEWGEPKKAPQTWRELLVERAENWLTEPVNRNGKTRTEDSYSWSPATTRIAYLVDQHLQLHIDQAMKAALLDANKKIASGIMEAVRTGLNSAAAGIKVEVKTR
jgi:hypothetical protein